MVKCSEGGAAFIEEQVEEAAPMADPRAFIPEPLTLEEAVYVPLPKNSGLLRPLAVVLLQHMRCVLPWLPVGATALATKPRKTLLAMALYWGLVIQRKPWKEMVKSFAAYGSSNRPRLLNCMRQKEYDPNKQYMLAAHPHGFLCENIFNVCARACPEFGTTGKAPCMPGLGPFTLCFAPAVGWYPVYAEMCDKHITDASAASVRRVIRQGINPMVCPGGFSEAVYTGSSDKYEHAYLDGRMGFLKLAIEHGIDVAPIYAFGLNNTYNTWSHKRHERSVWAQDTGLPGVWPFGKFGSAVPLNEDYVTAFFDPFPTSKYTVDQLEQCSKDYADYLKRCFDAHKGCVPSEANKEFLVVGKKLSHEAAMVRSKL